MIKAFIGDYVKTHPHNHVGRVFAKHHNFAGTNENEEWFKGQRPALSEEARNMNWYSILCHKGGSVTVPESDLIKAQTTPINGEFENPWEVHYFRTNHKTLESLSIGITPIYNGEYMSLQEDRESDGSYARIEKLKTKISL